MTNVIYIHTHDSGRILSPYGYAVPTPNLLKFANDAVLFRQAYCVNPTCSPSRAALLTGLYPHQNGMLGLAHRGFKLNDYNQHLVPYLGNNGYTTVLSGIQHEAGHFTEHEFGKNTIGYQVDISADISLFEEEEYVNWDHKNATNIAKWLKETTLEKPLFLSYGMFATHRKYPLTVDENVNTNYVQVPGGLIDNQVTRDDYAHYLTSAKSADDCFEIVVQALKEKGIYEESVIIFTTDHGIAMPFNKCTLSDNGIGVALMIKTPNMKSKGLVSDQLVTQLDIFPTICELVDLEPIQAFEGKSLVKVLEEPDTRIHEEVFAEINFHTSYEPARCVRTNRYKYVQYFDSYDNINYSNIDNSEVKDWYMQNGLTEFTKTREALYDLVFDVSEKNNLINDPSLKQVIEDLKNRLLIFMKKTNDPLLKGPIVRQNNWKINLPECVSAGSKNTDDYEVIN